MALLGMHGWMMRDGPFPLSLHGMLEYVAGAVFVAAPLLLDFESGAATAISIAIGVLVLAMAAATDGPTSLVNQIPRPAHVLLDYVVAVVLIASPFLAGFSDETAPTVLFLAGGVIHLLVTIGTRFKTRRELQPERDAAELERASEGRAERGTAAEPEPGTAAERGTPL